MGIMQKKSAHTLTLQGNSRRKAQLFQVHFNVKFAKHLVLLGNRIRGFWSERPERLVAYAVNGPFCKGFSEVCWVNKL